MTSLAVSVNLLDLEIRYVLIIKSIFTYLFFVALDHTNQIVKQIRVHAMNGSRMFRQRGSNFGNVSFFHYDPNTTLSGAITGVTMMAQH